MRRVQRAPALRVRVDVAADRQAVGAVDDGYDPGGHALADRLVGGDGRSASIAAASILAKVSRDRYVSTELDAKYPQYQFAKHKGYGTKLHYQMLDQYGPCPEHRMTFLKKWEAKRHG